jgi:hypothetical protein
MKQIVTVILLAACVGLGWSGVVNAGADLGQHCFQLAGGAGATLRISVVQGDGSALMFQLHGRWRGTAEGSPFQLLGAGLFTQSHPAISVWSMGLTFVNPSGTFSTNSTCGLHADLDGALSGTWGLDCLPLSLTGTMTYVACTDAM